jgi:hypothetical protein
MSSDPATSEARARPLEGQLSFQINEKGFRQNAREAGWVKSHKENKVVWKEILNSQMGKHGFEKESWLRSIFVSFSKGQIVGDMAGP